MDETWFAFLSLSARESMLAQERYPIFYVLQCTCSYQGSTYLDTPSLDPFHFNTGDFCPDRAINLHEPCAQLSY